MKDKEIKKKVEKILRDHKLIADTADSSSPSILDVLDDESIERWHSKQSGTNNS